MRRKMLRKLGRKLRRLDVRMEQKERWARLRKFKAAARTSLGNETRSGGSEIPNSRQADHGCEKADHENVEATGVGVGHSILHHYEENRKAPPAFAL